MYPYNTSKFRNVRNRNMSSNSAVAPQTNPKNNFMSFDVSTSKINSNSNDKDNFKNNYEVSCEDNYKNNEVSDMHNDNMPDNSDNNQNNKNNESNMNNENNMNRENNMDNQPVINRYILEMIKSALSDEGADADYYNRLANMIKDADDSALVHRIHHDENKHYSILSNIYYQLTGVKPEQAEFEKKEISGDLEKEFAKSILSELDGAEFYRKLMTAFLNIEFRDWFLELMTDEQSHAQIMNYLFSKYNSK